MSLTHPGNLAVTVAINNNNSNDNYMVTIEGIFDDDILDSVKHVYNVAPSITITT